LLLDILALWLFTFYVLDSQLQTTYVQWPVWYTHRYTYHNRANLHMHLL
jgi:hypothetical protein